jgi:putative transposase
MARLARIVVPGAPHHVTQRGNRRMDVFFSDDDREAYLEILHELARKHGLSILAYCLMTNHVHLLAVPVKEESLALAVGWTHNQYTRRINFANNWRGYLWQGRFHSCPLDDRGAVAAMRYIELNPVRAGLVKYAEQWPWSSAAAHAKGKADRIIVRNRIEFPPNEWRDFLREGVEDDELRRLRRHTRTGRPMGDEAFIAKVERLVGRTVRRGKPGPKGKRKKA